MEALALHEHTTVTPEDGTYGVSWQRLVAAYLDGVVPKKTRKVRAAKSVSLKIHVPTAVCEPEPEELEEEEEDETAKPVLKLFG